MLGKLFYEPIALPLGDGSSLAQGDLVCSVPFLGVRINAVQLLDDQGRTTVADLSDLSVIEQSTSAQFLTASFTSSIGMVLSQGCDLERGDKPVTLAAVRPITSIYFGNVYENGAVTAGFTKRLNDLKNAGKFPSILPIPPLSAQGFEMDFSAVDLFRLQTFAAADVPFIKKLVRGRMSHDGRAFLQERLSYFYGRFAAPDNLLCAT